jgi:hypothetical protein
MVEFATAPLPGETDKNDFARSFSPTVPKPVIHFMRRSVVSDDSLDFDACSTSWRRGFSSVPDECRVQGAGDGATMG